MEVFHLRHGDIVRLGHKASFRVHMHGGSGYCMECRGAWKAYSGMVAAAATSEGEQETHENGREAVCQGLSHTGHGPPLPTCQGASAEAAAPPSRVYDYEPGESYVSGTHRSYLAKRDMKQSYGLTKPSASAAAEAAYLSVPKNAPDRAALMLRGKERCLQC